MEDALLEARLCGIDAVDPALAADRPVQAGSWRCDGISITQAPPHFA
jgi:hypothetical protein